MYTIHGPDGVGKTTACDLASQTFGLAPLGYKQFHHVTGWKRKGEVNAASGRSSKEQIPNFGRSFLKLIYRNLPQIFRDVWVLSTSYVKYSRGINNLISEHYENRDIVLCDRYIYDLTVKNSLEDYRNIIHRIVHGVHSRLQRRPKLAIVLRDKPENIIKRKRELSLEHIGRYQTDIVATLEKMKVPYKIISVEGRKPDEVAEEIVRAIMDDVGNMTVELVRHFNGHLEIEANKTTL